MIDIEKLKEYASCLMTIPNIAVLMDIDIDELTDEIRNRKTDISKAYYKGKAETILAIRQQEIQLAKAASPMAIELAQEFLIEQSQHEN